MPKIHDDDESDTDNDSLEGAFPVFSVEMVWDLYTKDRNAARNGCVEYIRNYLQENENSADARRIFIKNSRKIFAYAYKEYTDQGGDINFIYFSTKLIAISDEFNSMRWPERIELLERILHEHPHNNLASVEDAIKYAEKRAASLREEHKGIKKELAEVENEHKDKRLRTADLDMELQRLSDRLKEQTDVMAMMLKYKEYLEKHRPRRNSI